MSNRTLSEAASKDLLAGYRVPFAPERVVTGPDAAVDAATELGFPVVVKLNGDAIAHKTERGLVRLGLADDAAVHRAATELLAAAPAPEAVVPRTQEAVRPEDLLVPDGFHGNDWDCGLSGSPHLWDDYSVGERIDHSDGMTLEEAEHQLATRLYQNTAKVHFDQLLAAEGRFGKRLVYGGHVISMARALSFNGLGNAIRIAAINGGRHVAPTFAGDTLFAWSEVLDRQPLPGREDLGALRLRTVAVKNRRADSFPDKQADGKPDPSVVLDLDYTVLMPRRGAA